MTTYREYLESLPRPYERSRELQWTPENSGFRVGQRVTCDVAYACGARTRPLFGTVLDVGECPTDGPFVRVEWDIDGKLVAENEYPWHVVDATEES